MPQKFCYRNNQDTRYFSGHLLKPKGNAFQNQTKNPTSLAAWLCQFVPCLRIQPWGYDKSGTSINSLNTSAKCWVMRMGQVVDSDITEIITHSIHVWYIYLQYIYHKDQPNAGKYTIHGWYGLGTSATWLLCLCYFHLSQTSLSLLQKRFTRKTVSGHVRHDFFRDRRGEHECIKSIQPTRRQT